MKKAILTLFLLPVCIWAYSQVSPVKTYRIQNITTDFGLVVPAGSIIVDMATGDTYTALSSLSTTDDLATGDVKLSGSGFDETANYNTSGTWENIGKYTFNDETTFGDRFYSLDTATTTSTLSVLSDLGSNFDSLSISAPMYGSNGDSVWFSNGTLIHGTIIVSYTRNHPPPTPPNDIITIKDPLPTMDYDIIYIDRITNFDFTSADMRVGKIWSNEPFTIKSYDQQVSLLRSEKTDLFIHGADNLFIGELDFYSDVMGGTGPSNVVTGNRVGYGYLDVASRNTIYGNDIGAGVGDFKIYLDTNIIIGQHDFQGITTNMSVKNNILLTNLSVGDFTGDFKDNLWLGNYLYFSEDRASDLELSNTFFVGMNPSLLVSEVDSTNGLQWGRFSPSDLSKQYLKVNGRFETDSFHIMSRTMKDVIIYVDSEDSLFAKVGTNSAVNLMRAGTGSGSGATVLSDLTDISSAGQTSGFSLMSDGGDYYGRALVEADISDLGTYGDLKADGTVSMTDAFDLDGNTINNVNSLYLEPKASASSDGADQGQLWVKEAWTRFDTVHTMYPALDSCRVNATFDDYFSRSGDSIYFYNGSLYSGAVIDSVYQSGPFWRIKWDAAVPDASYNEYLVGNTDLFYTDNRGQEGKVLAMIGEPAGAQSINRIPYLNENLDAAITVDFYFNPITGYLNAPRFSTTIGSSSDDWDVAYGWGDHSSEGYLTTEIDGSLSNEIQTIGILGNNISLTDGGGSIDVSTSTAVTANSAKVTNATHTGEVAGSTTLTIANNIIKEVNLEATNSPTDNYLPSYDAATGGFTWVESVGTDNQTAVEVPITDGGGFYDATTVEAALQEIYSEAVEMNIYDSVGAMVTGNTETRITVTHQADETLDFIVDSDLSNYSNTTSQFLVSTDIANMLSIPVTERDNAVLTYDEANNRVRTSPYFYFSGDSLALVNKDIGDQAKFYLEGSVQFNSRPASGYYSGEVDQFVAGESITLGDVVFRKFDTDTVFLASASAKDSCVNLYMACQTIIADDWGKFLADGHISATRWSFTKGETLFLATAGSVSVNPPTTANYYVVSVGCPINDSTVRFKPSFDKFKIAP